MDGNAEPGHADVTPGARCELTLDPGEGMVPTRVTEEVGVSRFAPVTLREAIVDVRGANALTEDALWMVHVPGGRRFPWLCVTPKL